MLANGATLGERRLMLKQPVTRGDRCVLEFGDLYFEVTQGVGGRVTSARFGSHEILSPASVHPLHFGSTFWTSPQSDWSWPPVAEVDSAVYEVTSDESSFSLLGPRVSAPAHPAVDQIRVRKTFRADPEHQAIRVEYAISNEGARPTRLAPWEITRVAGGGLTFYASDGEPATSGPFPLTPTTRAGGALWFQHEDGFAETKQCNAGKGWIAHATQQGALLIKVFANLTLAEAAPGEGEIEIYSNTRYVEVENQGAYAEIPPGGISNWTVCWYLRKLPPSIALRSGSAALLSFVTATIQ
jgi:hypothetical protein